jgi:HD superfamily phosphodiesterase
MLFETVRKEMECFFGNDAHEISHALEVTSHALQIQAVEGGNRDVVTMASLLHDVGIKPAKEQFGSSAGHYQERLGPQLAGDILGKLSVEEEKIATVKELIAHHHTPGIITTKEFACLWDADFIVNLREVAPRMASEKLRRLIDEKFMTNEGKRIAREIFLQSTP